MKFVPSYVKAKVLTHDPGAADPARTGQPHQPRHLHRICWICTTPRHGSFGMRGDPRADAGAGRGLRLGGRARRADEFFERLGSPVKRLELLPGFYHDVYHEEDAARPLR